MNEYYKYLKIFKNEIKQKQLLHIDQSFIDFAISSILRSGPIVSLEILLCNFMQLVRNEYIFQQILSFGILRQGKLTNIFVVFFRQIEVAIFVEENHTVMCWRSTFESRNLFCLTSFPFKFLHHH